MESIDELDILEEEILVEIDRETRERIVNRISEKIADEILDEIGDIASNAVEVTKAFQEIMNEIRKTIEDIRRDINWIIGVISLIG